MIRKLVKAAGLRGARGYLWAFALLLVVCPLGAQGPPAVPQAPELAAPSDAAPHIKSFPRDLARNFVNLCSRDNGWPFLFGATATVATVPADDDIANYFQDPSHWQGFDGVGRRLGKSQVLGPAIGVSFLASRLTDNVKFQKVTYSLAQGFIINNAVTGGLKALELRERPDKANHYSFPSGHSSNSFMWATVLSRHYGWKAGVPAYAFAAYVGTSRLKTGKHYLSDVMAGAAIGYLIGRTVTRTDSGVTSRRILWGLAVPPGGGAALTVGVHLW